jgi:hypothetical protein
MHTYASATTMPGFRILKLGLSAEEQKMVLYDNARQLLGLP